MTIDIDETIVKRNEFGLWLAWTLATALGMLIGYLPLAFLVSSLDLGVARVIVPIISGILLGLAQWLVLRPYVTKSYDWILYNAVGWMVGFTLGLFVVQLLSKTPVGLLLGFVFFGVIVAVFQYPVLRREIPHLGTWTLANVIGWTLGAYLSQLAKYSGGASWRRGRFRFSKASGARWIAILENESQRFEDRPSSKGLRLEATLNLQPLTSNGLSSTYVVFFSKKGFSKSMGTGKIVVEFFSVATSVRVCKNLN